MASLESIHVRVKRKNQTFFLLVSLTQNKDRASFAYTSFLRLQAYERNSLPIQVESPDMPVVGLKEKLVLLFADKGIKSPLDLRLLYEDLILDDDVSLRSQRVVDSSILHLWY